MSKSMTRNVLTAVAMAVVTIGILAGCGEKANPNLATPTLTLQTYLSVLDALANYKGPEFVNLGTVKEGLQCFSKADRKWFEKNWKTIPLDELTGNAIQALYDKPVLQAAMTFAHGIVPWGPRRGSDLKMEVVSQSDAEATVKLTYTSFYSGQENSRTVPLVKEGPNWQIKGLFKPSNEPNASGPFGEG